MESERKWGKEKMNGQRMKVLLVEDEEVIRQGMRLTTPWQDYGCEVIGEAVDGEDGRKKILELKPDIVITDVKMPKMSGLEMIESLREQASCEYIILSGYDDFAFAQKAMHLEVHGYLLKPVDDDELSEVLENTIRRIREKQIVYKSLSERMEKEGNQEKVDFHNLQDKYLDRACKILKERYQENLTLKSVADELYISDSYLGKLFKSKTGYTFLEILTLYRIKKAVAFLEDTDMKVYEIAYAIGYSDSKYFSKVFRKVTGMKPMELKNGHRLAADNILNQL